MDCNSINTLINRYKSVLSAQMTKSLGKSVINLYSNLPCSVLGIGNQQELSTDLESNPFLNPTRRGAMLQPVAGAWLGLILGPKNDIKVLVAGA